MVSFKNSFKLFHNVLLLRQSTNRLIIVSFSGLQKEQSLALISLQMQQCLLRYKVLYNTLYWKTCNLVIIVTTPQRI